MSYRENEISKENLAKYVEILDSDEGIRIDNKKDTIFINKAAKRYCIGISKEGRDEFVYESSSREVMNFLADKITSSSRIFSY